MSKKLKQFLKAKDLHKDILFVLFVLFIFRIAAHIPVPGIDSTGIRNFLTNNQALGLFNLFTGGGLENFSIVMLGVGPYISSSIIFQLLTMIIPSLEELSKESESGRKKIMQWTRIAAVPLSLVQGLGTILFLSRGGALSAQAGGAATGLFGQLSNQQLFTAVISVVAGSIFLMWLGELISERKVGNGLSLLIFVGIISSLPQAVNMLQVNLETGVLNILDLSLFLLLGLITIAAVVFITEGQRNIPVVHARQASSSRLAGNFETYLPLRVNQAGVIPIIFAISVVLFPTLVANVFRQSSTDWLRNFSLWLLDVFNNNLIYGALYFVLVVIFTYFYTAIVFNPTQIAENLQRQGSFIPGIRPGEATAKYLQNIMSRIMLAGALFLGLVAILPVIGQSFSNFNLLIGGTSLLIVVSVVIETMKQIDAQLIMRDYEIT